MSDGDANSLLPQALPATAADTQAVVELLVRAYAEADTVTGWLLRRDRNCLRRLEAWFAFLAKTALKKGEVHLLPSRAAAALWVSTARWPSMLDEVGLGVVAARLAGLRHLHAKLRVLKAAGEQHPPRTHRHLLALGTQPERQGRGYGSAILEHGLEICDRQGTPAGLETLSERTQRFYERHGFCTCATVPTGNSDRLIRVMWREPRPEAHQSGTTQA